MSGLQAELNYLYGKSTEITIPLSSNALLGLHLLPRACEARPGERPPSASPTAWRGWAFTAIKMVCSTQLTILASCLALI